MSLYDEFLQYQKNQDKLEKKKKKKKQKSEEIPTNTLLEPYGSSNDIAPTKTTTKSSVLGNDTRQMLGDLIDNYQNKIYKKDQFKSIWDNGYQKGDVLKTIGVATTILNPIIDFAKDKAQTVQNYISGEKKINAFKDSKAMKEAKETTKELWSDGWDFRDIDKTIDTYHKAISKTILGTAGDTTANVVKGELQTAEGLVDTGRYVASDLLKWAGYDKASKYVKKNAIQNTTGMIFGENDDNNNIKQDGWAKKVDEYSVFDNTIDQINQSIGQQAFRIGLQKALMGKAPEGGATSKLVKGINQLEIFAGSYGQAKSEAYMNGADDKTAFIRGMVSGTTEYISENLFDSLPGFKTGELKGITKIKNVIGEGAEKTFGKKGGKLVLQLFNGLGEGTEEVLSNVLDTTFTDVLNYIMPEYTYGMKEGQGIRNTKGLPIWKQIKDIYESATSDESKEAFITSMISTFITSAATDYANTQQRNQIIDAWAEDNDFSKEKAHELFELVSELRQSQLVDENTGFTERMEVEENVNQQLQQEVANGANLEELFIATPKNRQESQFIFTNDERKNIKSEQQKVLANDLQRINNTKEVHDTYNIVNRVQAINKTQQYHLTTTEGLYEMGIVNKNENGEYTMPDGKPYVPRGLNYGKNGDIYVNVDVGTQSGTQAMYHEMFEGFKKASPEQYNTFKQMVRDIVGEQTIQDEVAQYKQMYGEELTDNIEDEIINDKFGELAENQKFINKIADNRSVLEKFVDSIKNMIKYVKGTPQERQLIKLQNKLEKEFAKRYKKTDFSKNEGETAYSIKESKAMLEKQFKDLTGDSLLLAEAKLGNYAFQQIRGNQVETPYNQEAMNILEKIQNSKKTSSHLYHSTPADRIQSIVENGLKVGSKQNQEGVSSADKLYLSATEELANSFTPEDSVMLRISPNANLENLDNDLLGGEGSYTITNNIEPKYLQVKENGKWIPLLKSKYAVKNTAFSLQTNKDSQGRTLTKEQQNYFKDSKVVDENGNLKVVYHGTTHPGFNVFKASQGDSQFGKYKFGDLDVNYFTASKDTARGYTEIGIEENGNIYETYLNITNPYIVDNTSNAVVKSWKTIKDNNIRQYETDYYNDFEYKWNREKSIKANLNAINEDLFPFNCELRFNDGYYELYDLGKNDGFGENLVLYVNEDATTIELFDEGIKEGIYGESFDDYYYTSDRIAKWILTQNADGAEYDGIIIPNIVDTGTKGNMFGEPTTDYITFNSNQIKNVDNTNPTNSPDIRYSLAPSGEMVDNNGNKVTFDVSEVETDIPIRDEAKLMVLHNLGENKMNGIMDLGGIPVPSIAVTNPNVVSHDQFGEISLIFDKSTINPANRKNEIYDRDIWSPTFPRIEYEANMENVKEIKDLLGIGNSNYENLDTIQKQAILSFYQDNIENQLDGRDLESLKDSIKNNSDIKYAYMKSKNQIEPIYKKTEYSDSVSNDTLKEYVNFYNNNKFNNMSLDDFYYHYLNYGDMQLTDDQNAALKATIRDYYYKDKVKEAEELFKIDMASKRVKSADKQKYIDMWVKSAMDKYDNSYFEYKDFIRDAVRYDNNGEQQEIDTYATIDKVRNTINQEEFNKWVDETFTENIIKDKGIRNDKDIFTPSGNRRSFKSTHNPVNLQNLVKELSRGNTKGGQEMSIFGTGFGRISAQQAKQFKSIEDIKANQNRLMSREEASKIIEPLAEKLQNDTEELAKYHKTKNYGSDFVNSMESFDISGQIIEEFAGKKLTLDNFRKTIDEWGISFDSKNIPDSVLQNIINDLEQTKNLPTDYFEAKPQRAVGLDEIQMAVIPNNTSEELKQRLKDNNIKYTEYNPDVEGDRQRVINQFSDLKFSLTSNQNINSKEIAPVNTTTEEQLAPIREDISNISNQLNNLSNQIETLQNGLENNPRGYVESYREQRNENIPTRQLTEDEANLRQEALMNDEGYLKSLQEQANYDVNDKFIKSLTNDIQAQLSVDKYDRYRVENLIRDAVENNLSADEIRNRVEKDFSSYNETYNNEELKNVKQDIRSLKIKVPSGVKSEIADYRKFKDSNFGKITFSNYGQGIDVVYAQLSDMYPQYFPNDIINETDQLQKIAEVANTANNVVSKQYFDMDYLDDVSDYISDAVLNYKANNQIDSQASLDKDIQFGFTEDIAPTTIRTQESIDNYIDNRDIAPVNKQQVRPKSNLQTRAENMYREIQQKFINRNYLGDKLAKATGNNEIKFAGDNLNNVSGEASFNINNKQTDINGHWIGKGVKQLFEPARKSGKYEMFNDYLVQKSNIERHNVGKGSQVPLEVSKQLVTQYEAENPEFKTWAKDVYKYFDNVLQQQVDAGLITQERYNDYRGENGIYRSYVPFYPGEIDTNRFYDNEGNLKPVSTLKRSKGGATDVNQMLSVEESMAKQTYALKRAIRMNEYYKQIISTMEKYDAMFDGDMRDNPTNLDDSLFITDNGDKVLSAYIDGKKVSALISDELYNELSGDNEAKIKQFEQDFSLITKPLQKMSSVRRKLITTWNPAFLMRNAIKDVQDAVINSKHTGKMLKNLTGNGNIKKTAIYELYKADTKESQQFLALYGAENLLGDYSVNRNNMSIAEQFQTDYINSINDKNMIRKFSRLNELIELAPRFAEFKASLQNGESVQEAIYNAREVTTNFGRGGYITKAMNRNGFTFLNANVQGLDKLVRNLSGENGVKGVVAVVTKGAMFAVLPSILNDLMFGSGDDKDEEYEALPDYIKDNYYLIKTEGNHFVRIPKGRINAVFGSAARRLMNTIETGENQFDGYLSNAWSQIGVGDLGGNNIFSPIIQATNNKAWYGGDIVPTRLQKKPAEEQTDAKIDKISNFIGETFNISPYKVNYVLDQYSGGIGDILLPMITDETTNGAEGAEFLTAPLKDAFSVNSTDDNKYAGEFYDTKDKLEIAKNSANATADDIVKYDYMSNISKELGELYKEKREVQADTTLSNKEKYAKVQKIQDSINSLAKEAMSEYQNVKTTENYSRVSDEEFYKNNESKWTKVSDSDSEFTAGMTDTEKSSYFNVKNKIGVIYDDYNKKIKNLSKKDSRRDKYAQEKRDGISQAIINSGLDDYSKAILYSKYYVSGDKNFTAQEKMTNVYNAGFDIDTYITAMNDLDQIRDKYSQANGYSTATRKNKTISYINSLNIEIPQKAMLIRKYYKAFRSYNNDIVNYVADLNLSYEEKVAILEQTGMTVNGNNVSWK